VSVLQAGHDAIAAAVASCRPPVVVVEQHRQFGDILHATIVVRHLRAVLPEHRIVLAICEQYAETLSGFDVGALGPHAYALLPRLPAYPDDASARIAWVQHARTLPGVVRAFGCGPHPWGAGPGSIVDAVLRNAGIDSLVVERRPCLPIRVEDVHSARAFLAERGLSRYIALEYRSFSYEPLPPAWWESFVRAVGIPVVALAHPEAPMLAGAIDGRATTLRQAKSIIADAACFVGSGSGLSVLAAALGCESPVVENCDPPICMPAIGYRRSGDRHLLCQTRQVSKLVEAVHRLVKGGAVVIGNAPVVTGSRGTRAQRTRVRTRRNSGW
jgi:hypothetical protein